MTYPSLLNLSSSSGFAQNNVSLATHSKDDQPQELSPANSNLCPLMSNFYCCYKLDMIMESELLAPSSEKKLEDISIKAVATNPLLELLESEHTVPRSQPEQFSQLNKAQQVALIEYAQCAHLSYAENLEKESIHQIFDVYEEQSSSEITQNDCLNKAVLELNRQQALQKGNKFNNLNLNALRNELAHKGITLSPKGNMVYSNEGVVARLFLKKNTADNEVTIAFPGLGAQGTSQEQTEKRFYAVIDNFIPCKPETLYDEALEMTNTLTETIKNYFSHFSCKPTTFSVVGHSLGGGFAMEAAKNKDIDHSIIFQSLISTHAMFNAATCSKTIDVFVDEDATIPSFLQHIGNNKKVTSDTHPLLPLDQFPTHTSFYFHLLLNMNS